MCFLNDVIQTSFGRWRYLSDVQRRSLESERLRLSRERERDLGERLRRGDLDLQQRMKCLQVPLTEWPYHAISDIHICASNASDTNK